MNKKGRGITLIGIFLALFLAALDQTIVSTALPRITAELHGEALYAWVATSYLLFAAVSGPVFGRLSELVKSKWLLTVAAGIFLVGSALCGMAPSMPFLIGFRGLQGIGGGALFACVFATLGFMYEPRERGKIQGYFGAVWGLSSVIGPFLGGLIVDHFSWRWVFYLNMPVGAVALAIIWWRLQDLAPSEGQAFDYLGAVSLATGIIPLILAVSMAGTVVAPLSWPVAGLVALAAAGFAWFVWTERHSKSPLVDLGLFEVPVFRWVNAALLFYGMAFLGVILFLPLYLVQARHVSASSAGLLLTPLTLGVVTTSVLSGRVASKVGRYKVMLVGSLAWFVAMAGGAAILIGHEPNLWLLGGVLVLVGLGLGPGAPLFTLAVQNGVPHERIGTASSTTLLFRQIGQTAGAAVLGAVLIATVRSQVPEHLPPASKPFASQLSQEVQGDPAQIAAGVKQAYRGLEDKVDRAVAGDAAARAEVARDPRLKAVEPDVVRGDRAAAHQHLQAAAKQTTADLQKALALALTSSMVRVFGITALAGLFAFLASLFIPNTKLKGKEDEGSAPPARQAEQGSRTRSPERRRDGYRPRPVQH